MSDPIKAALDEAAKRLCFGHNGEDCDMCVAPEHCYKAHTFLRKDAAAAIAAFHRRLEAHYREHGPELRWAVCGTLAAAVEEAARHD